MKKFLTRVGIFILLFCHAIGVTHAALISLKAVSAGFDDPGHSPGGTAQLLVDSVDYSLNKRGFNMLVVNQNSGTIIDSVTFDTHGSAIDAENMATYINSLGAGDQVLSAVKDSCQWPFVIVSSQPLRCE